MKANLMTKSRKGRGTAIETVVIIVTSTILCSTTRMNWHLQPEQLPFFI